MTLSGSGTVTLGTKTLTLTDPSTTFSGAIDGTGGLTVDGTETLTGDLNTYSGITTIDSGDALAAGIANAFSANSAVTDNGELDLGTTDQTIAALNGAGLVGSFTGTGTAPAVLTVSDGGSFAGVIQDGTGTAAGSVTALTLTGGTLTLSGLNTYSGATTIDGLATLALSGTGSIADSSDVIDDGTFDISATTSGASIVTLWREHGHRHARRRDADAVECVDHVQRRDRRQRRADGQWQRDRDADGRQSLWRRDHDRFRRDPSAEERRLDRGLQRRHRQRHP